MEIGALVEVGTAFCNCKEWKRMVVTEKINAALYVLYSSEWYSIFVILVWSDFMLCN